MDKAIKLRPSLSQILKKGGNLFIAANVAVKNQFGIEFFSEIDNAVFEALTNVGKGQFSPFAVACLGNTIGNRAVREKPGNQDFFAGEKAHVVSFTSNMISYLQLLHICPP